MAVSARTAHHLRRGAAPADAKSGTKVAGGIEETGDMEKACTPDRRTNRAPKDLSLRRRVRFRILRS